MNSNPIPLTYIEKNKFIKMLAFSYDSEDKFVIVSNGYKDSISQVYANKTVNFVETLHLLKENDAEKILIWKTEPGLIFTIESGDGFLIVETHISIDIFDEYQEIKRNHNDN